MAIVDPLSDVKSLLDAQWNAGNVTEPTLVEINHVDTPLRHDLANNGDVLLVRAGFPAIEETPIGNHTYGNREYIVQLDIFTIEDRDRLWSLVNEVARICHANRHSMSNFQRILFEGMDELGVQEFENLWGATVTIGLENRAVLLET